MAEGAMAEVICCPAKVLKSLNVNLKLTETQTAWIYNFS